MSRPHDRDNAVVEAIALASVDLLAYFEYRVGRDDAPDLLAETMTTAWRRSADLPLAQEEARMWLFGIARNVLANGQRSERRRWRLANKLRAVSGSLHPTISSSADAGLDVRDAVNQLSTEHAELIRLVHWDGFNITEAAELCGIPASTARSRYQIAKQRLRLLLEPEQVEA